MDTVGDLARTLVLRTHQTRLNRDLDRLGTEIATGFVSDPAAHLGGDVTALVAIDRSLAQLETYRVNTTEAAFLTGTMQTTLEEIQDELDPGQAMLVYQVGFATDLGWRTMGGSWVVVITRDGAPFVYTPRSAG